MFSLTFAQMRRSIGRLAAAGVAIAIGTAFVAATLLASDLLKRASYDSIAAQYGSAELVVRGSSTFDGETGLDARQLEAVRGLDGVAAADPVGTAYLQLRSGERTVYQAAIAVPSAPSLQPLTVTAGAMPTTDDEIALPGDIATLLDVQPGDTVTEVWSPPEDTTGSDTDAVDPAVETELTVTGLLDDPYKAYATQGGAAVVSAGTFAERRWSGDEPLYRDVAVDVAPDGDVAAVRAEIDSIITGSASVPDGAAAPGGVTVTTKDEAAEAAVDAVTGGQGVFTATILAFAAIALLVAALVISNTFQVIVAQRTRTLALLRCVGAKKSQLRLSVVLEAATLGLASSAVGVVVGSAFVQVATMVLGRMDLDIPIPGHISLSVAAAVWPLVVGTLVTVAASLVPARAATRVAPLEAMRPAEAPDAASRGGRVRLAFSLALVLGGALLMVGGLLLSSRGDITVSLLAAVAGGGISFVGVLVGAVFWVPRVVGAVGRLLGSAGPSAQLAAANITRNPRRTAATSSALLIGVTLVAMMSVGAATARTSLSSTLDGTYNVDVEVRGASWYEGTSEEPFSPTLLSELGELDGVAEIVPVTDAQLTVEGGGSVSQGDLVQIVDPDAAKAVLRDPSMLEGLDDTTVVVSESVSRNFLLGDTSLTLHGPLGEVTLDVVVRDLANMSFVVDRSVGDRLVGSYGPTSAWVQVTDIEGATPTVNTIKDVVSSTSAYVTGAAVERATMEQAIDTMLAVVVGLLAIAVVIALIGVANTLSLSVLERRRESATLRAIGLSRRQLRATLALEGVLIAAVGAVIGILLGLAYGWVGSVTVLGAFADVSLTVPFGSLGLVVLVALVAGLLASVVPGRTAARTSPVEALAVD